MGELTYALMAGGLASLPFAVLTTIGELARGQGVLVAVVAGVFFPVTWVAWYVRDRDLRPTPHRSGQPS